MKKFTLKAIALATASICGSAAFAGTIIAPADPVPYAVEGLNPNGTTDLSVAPVSYMMGVTRTAAQDFTMIFRPSAGSTFVSCPDGLTGLLLSAGAGAITASNKRNSATECAYEIDVTTATDLTTVLTLTGLTLDTHNLATAGNSASIVLGVWELAENARIDNTTDLTQAVATSGNALRLTATQDTATTTDVDHPAGPLFGFVADGDDGADEATASFVVNNNTGTTVFMLPDGVTPWDFSVDGTALDVTVTGNFQGLEEDGFTYDGDLGAGIADVDGDTATFSFAPGDFLGGVGNYTVSTSFLSALTASLGTSRTFGVSAVGDVVNGADVALAGNAAWWVWDANASQLMTPYFTTNSIFLSRFFFLNTGGTDVGYTADCYSETGNAITYGAGRTGTLSANGTTAVNASSVCTFAGAARGSIIFTISAPINTVKGSYQYIDQVTLNGANTMLVRPYGQGNVNE